MGLVVPDANPLVRLYASGLPPRSYVMPLDPTVRGSATHFVGLFTPGGGDRPGPGFAFFTYPVAGRPITLIATFEVAAAGHPGGTIQAIHFQSLPAGGVLMAHEGAGRIVAGKGPHLDRGSGGS
jgi:hypothetical protein